MNHCKQFGRPFAILKIFNGYINFLSLLITISLVMVVVMVMTAICFALYRWLLLILLTLILLTNRISQYSHAAPENIDHVFSIDYKHLLPIEFGSQL